MYFLKLITDAKDNIHHAWIQGILRDQFCSISLPHLAEVFVAKAMRGAEGADTLTFKKIIMIMRARIQICLYIVDPYIQLRI